MLEIISEVKGADADTNVMEVWAARDQDSDFVLIGSLALVTGKMTFKGSSRLYNDTAVNTEADASFEAIVTNSASDSIAKMTIERNGYAQFLFIATTLNSDDLRPHICTYERHNVPS